MNTIDLDGFWYFTIDQDPEYHQSEDYSRSMSLRHWERVIVPGCWNRYADRYDLYEGVAWFVREFKIDSYPPDSIATLRFGGVNYLADVYLNGRHLGQHEGGYTVFEMDASEALQAGFNRLAVRVDNRHLRLRLPAVLGWYNYGGLHRSVSLQVNRCARLKSVRVAAEPIKPGAIGLLQVATSHSDLTLNATIRDPQGALVWTHTARGGPWTVPFRLDTAWPWRLQDPVLYNLRVELTDGEAVLDQRECQFGIRRLRADAQRLLLNEDPIHLRGMCYLYDHPACGTAYDPRVGTADLDDLRSIGVNCLRSHFPLPEAFLEECDRCGMMLWLEAPIYCVHPASDQSGTVFADPGLKAFARQMVREMIEQAHNHPSVVIWSIGNECNTDHPESRAFFESCVQQVRALDPQRLISYAALYGAVEGISDLVDILSLNEYWGWYDRIAWDGIGTTEPPPEFPLQLPLLEACLAEKSALGKPLLLSEFGADAEPGFLSEVGALWSENYQAALIARQLEIAAQFPAVCGTFPFLYNDYRDPSKPITHYWHGINLKGIVSYTRRPKLAWEQVRRIYNRCKGTGGPDRNPPPG